MAWRRADIGAVQKGSGWRRLDIGAVQKVAAVGGVTIPVFIHHFKQAGGLCLPLFFSLLELILTIRGM